MTLEIITSDQLAPLRHGFFTRKGGASSGVFEGLNCGLGSSDLTDAVRINRGRVADALEIEAEALVSMHQIHSAEVVTITAPIKDRPKADGLVTAIPGLALAVLTADCQPVLFAIGKKVGVLRVIDQESVKEFRAHFISALADARPYRDRDRFAPRTDGLHGVDGGF